MPGVVRMHFSPASNGSYKCRINLIWCFGTLKLLLKVYNWVAKFFCKLQFGLLLTETHLHFTKWEILCLKSKLSHSILQFQSSFPNPKSKSHHKIVLLFKYRDKWFHKLLHGGNSTTGIGYQQKKSLLSQIFILSNCSWPIFLLPGKLALLIGTNGCSCWHKSGPW